ncbi:MAG TPA: putative porin [Myxococcaceae bacterium]|nr:putative porin [Myxococcaceae bacterium]
MPGCKKSLDTRLFIVCGVALWAGNSPAWGQERSAVEGAPPPATPPADATRAGENAPARPPPQSATAKLVQRLVERGLIDPAEAEALTAQAEAEARAANAQAESVKRVPYIPEVVKDEIRGDIKRDVLEEAKKNNWAAPNLLPEWTKRLRFYGDARVRYEIDNMGSGNAVDYYPDFNAINSGKPFDVNFRDPSSERWLNTNRRRSRVRVRARFGAEADIGQGFFTELRLGSGDSATPVSLNQTLGGSGGNFSKYQFWLDRAAIRYEHLFGQAGLEVVLGRFENPFFRTDLVWDENVNFDGAAFRSSVPLGGGFRSFFSAGISPIFNTAFDFAAERPDKFKSIDKWLYAAQVGADWRPAERVGLKLGVAYYFFDKVQGIVSSDCDTHIPSISCDTDHSRPSFAQKGNTYRLLRTPSVAALDSELIDGASRYQFFGLSSLFRELVATARLEFLALAELKLGMEGEVVRNLGFRPSSTAPDAVNNFKPCAADDSACRDNPPYGGGSLGYLARLSVGTPRMDRRWNWNVAVTYRYLQSDAVLDAFTNSEFALGGTNNKGFVAAAAVAIADNVILTARWLSSDVVVGPQYSIDVLHLDLMARY